MHKHLKAAVCFAVATLCLFSFTAFAQEPAQQGIRFVAHCKTTQDIADAIDSGADFVSLDSSISVEKAAFVAMGKVAVILDAETIEDADRLYTEASEFARYCEFYYRISESNSKVSAWAENKDVKIIGYYKGNIYPVALSEISAYGKLKNSSIIQMQTNNQDGVILHNTVTSHFEKHGVSGMFSFVDSTRSAKRTDSARSWDDLISRGYTVIETVYSADFAEYLKDNTAERNRLEESVNAALATSTNGCSSNRISDYQSALKTAQTLLADDTSATYAMADARAVLDEAIENINIQDGSQLKGDLEFTPGRIAWAVFGVALVLSWQLFFRSRWAKKKTD